MPTDFQKEIIKELFRGGSVAKCRLDAWRLRDENTNPLKTFTESTWRCIKRVCRADKKRGCWVIDKKEVRSLNGNHWVKKYYKEHGKEQTNKKTKTGTAAINS